MRASSRCESAPEDYLPEPELTRYGILDFLVRVPILLFLV